MARKTTWRCAALVALMASALGSHSAASGQDGMLEELYGRGVHAFFTGNYHKAYESLNSAIGSGSRDPRAYYFRALTLARFGRPDEAKFDIQEAARLEMLGGEAYPIGKALERIQGTERCMLEEHRREARLAIHNSMSAQERARYEQLRRSESDALRGTAPRAPAAGARLAPDATDPFARPLAPATPPPAPPAPAPLPTPAPAAPLPAESADPFAAPVPQAEAPPAPAPAPPVPMTPTPPPPAAADPFAAPADPAAPPAAAPPAAAPPAPATDPFAPPAASAPAPATPAPPAADSADPFAAPAAPPAAPAPTSPAPTTPDTADPFAAPAAPVPAPPVPAAPATGEDPFAPAPPATPTPPTSP